MSLGGKVHFRPIVYFLGPKNAKNSRTAWQEPEEKCQTKNNEDMASGKVVQVRMDLLDAVGFESAASLLSVRGKLANSERYSTIQTKR
jgi:hypothetical protein